MLKIIISGCCGAMGRVVNSCIAVSDNLEVKAGIDISGEKYDSFEVYKKINDITEKADVIIDFSHPSALTDILDYAVQTKTAAVIATTGLTDSQIEQIREMSVKIPIFFSFNMSLGINLIAELSRKAAAILSGDFDIEIIEAHHSNKLDAPSGTAIMLADAVTDAVNAPVRFEYDRHSKRKKRDKNEIGIHSIRGGTIVGEHEVIFAGRDEIITITHSARSKEVFAVGAVNAAKFLADKKPGLYNMNDLINSQP